jgi:hypothetical protein
MLNKVANIEPSKGYTSSSRKNATPYEKAFRTYVENVSHEHDSVQFSPAAVFLAAVQWRLAEVNYSSENEVVLEFCIGDIKFNVDLNFTDFYKTTHQKVKMEKVVGGINGSKKQVVELFVKKPPIRIFEKYSQFQISGIQALFEKISKLKLTGQIRKYETFTMSMLSEGLEDAIYRDFVNIFNVIYSFIAKLGKFGINKAAKFPESKAEKIIFEKIAVTNV